ncbi:MAG: DEAD/DEAH box helicase, partial [Acidimicrobiia bacterium]|nr:DEAD/DEAH box helicase [Acidimicrobiia bacterium]
GIDMGAVDHVVQVESPISVASGLQRVGRAGHQVGATSRMTIFPKYRGDLLVATVVAQLMRERAVESTRIPRNPLDVLAQQIVAAVAMDEWQVDDLYDLVRQAEPYADLGRAVFEATLDMLAGRYPSDLFAELRPRLTWDRVAGRLEARPGAQSLAVQNPGTIPDRGLYTVNLPDGGKVGELDEEMVYESRVGDVFLLGTTAWKISDITHDRVEVIPAPGEPGAKMPFWHGDMAGRPLPTGRAVGEFVRTIAAMDDETARTTLAGAYHLDEHAVENLLAYLREEQDTVGALPTDRSIVIERFRDEIGDWRLVLLSPFGARVHAPWAMALSRKFAARFGHDPNVIWADDGIAFRFPDVDDPPDPHDLLLDPEEVEALVVDQAVESALFAARFREAAARALLLPRRRPGQRTPLWLQRRRSADLLSVARQFGSFPMMLETYREILQDDFDLPSLVEILGEVRSRHIRVVDVDLDAPSPFASSLLFSFVAAYLYEADTPLAERRAAALTLDRELLRELLGEGELRELLSADVIEGLESELQRLAEGYRCKPIDGVHDLLRTIGPLTTSAVRARTDGDALAALDQLAAGRRVVEITIAGTPHWAAIEDAGRLRDALGVQPPPGIPHAYLEPLDDPLGDVVGRFARTHGPFTTAQAAGALGLPVAAVDTTLQRLEASGRTVAGEFRPGGAGREWVDADVLRRLKRRSLAALRHEIEPADPAALARLSVAWNGLSGPRPRRGSAALVEILGRLQGAVIPASVIERDVLASRMVYEAGLLDQLMVSGDWVWVGHGSLGARDGKLALYRRDQLPVLLLPRLDERPASEVHDRLRECLDGRGASFFRDLYEASGGGDPSVLLDALWDLVWAGEVTNDTLAPVRALLSSTPRGRSRRSALSGSFPPSSGGRWSLVSDLVGTPPSPTERATAWADQMLDRYGVVTRGAVLAEGIPGGFSGIYPVFRHLEEIGRIRRGYFVEGLGGSQFALPGAVDRLRSEPAADALVLAATDPANPYGGTLSWPDHVSGQPSRSAGAYVVLTEGHLVVYVERGGRRILTFTDDEAALNGAANALVEVGQRQKRFMVETVDDEPVTATPLGAALLANGFVLGPRGLAYRSR